LLLSAPAGVNWQREAHARGERGYFFLPYPALFSTVSEHLNAGRLRAPATNVDAHRTAAAGVDVDPVTRITTSTYGSACGFGEDTAEAA
jgi:hypothetical protein